jgi:hypothetical protein
VTITFVTEGRLVEIQLAVVEFCATSCSPGSARRIYCGEAIRKSCLTSFAASARS